MPEITVQKVTLAELLKALGQHSIRRVLLADYATIEPTRESGAMVMLPMVQVVATAFDRAAGVIYRWSERGESKRMVTIIAGTGKGPNPDGRLAARKEEIRQILREEGYEVDEGEWTPENARAFSEARAKAIG